MGKLSGLVFVRIWYDKGFGGRNNFRSNSLPSSKDCSIVFQYIKLLNQNQSAIGDHEGTQRPRMDRLHQIAKMEPST
jgi:hypothetical protein